jgi:hypothetical protein
LCAAERNRRSSIILGSAEAAIAGKFVEAAAIYAGHPVALQVRAMNIIYETTKDKGCHDSDADLDGRQCEFVCGNEAFLRADTAMCAARQ